MNNDIVKITSAYGECSSQELRFPLNRAEYEKYLSMESNELTGRTVVFKSHADKYITSDPLEIEFASRSLPFVRVSPVDSKELFEVFRNRDHFPHVFKHMTREEAAEFLFKDSEEDSVIVELQKLGYLKDLVSDEHSVEDKKESPKSPVNEALTDDELIQMLRDRGYVGMRKKK